MKVLSLLAEVLGCVSLYFGSGMLLIVPGGPGEPYLDWPRVKYGFAPTLLCVVLLCLAGWLWKQSGASASLGTYIRRAFQGAFGAVALFWVGLIVIAHIQGRIP